MNESPPPSSDADARETEAAAWLARRDRELTGSEQAAFLEWMARHPQNPVAINHLEKTWYALDRLAEHRTTPAFAPNPDGLVARRRSRRWIWAPVLAAAAAVAILLYPRATTVVPADTRRAIIHPGPERLVLEDGSIAELNQQAKIEVEFTDAERRVRLVQGQAHFIVAKNKARPFIVSAGQVAVRAVGTAFSVDLGAKEISVLVTEGKVNVDEVRSPSGNALDKSRSLSALVAGQQGVIALSSLTMKPADMHVTELDPVQLDRAMAWEGMRLEFVRMPLAGVVANFNRYNRRKLVVHDDATAAILVGGTFRPDNVDAFIRLLKVGFGVSAFPVGDQIILRKDQ